MMSRDLGAVIPFVRVPATQNPNSRGLRGEDPVMAYYRAMTVTFASLRRWNPALPLELITNQQPPREVRCWLGSVEVTIRLVPFSHVPPPGYAKRFIASFYILDALAASGDRDLLIVDPDVVCTGSAEALSQFVAKGLVGVYPLAYHDDHVINGLSPRAARELHDLLAPGAELSAYRHCGGECYLIPREQQAPLLQAAEEAWTFSLLRQAQGLSYFTTEEHLLSFAVRQMPTADLTLHVKRIWTARSYRNVDGTEATILLWHLPAEKDRGFQRLLPLVLDRSTWFWSAERDEFLAHVARVMNVQPRALYKLQAASARAAKALRARVRIDTGR